MSDSLIFNLTYFAKELSIEECFLSTVLHFFLYSLNRDYSGLNSIFHNSDKFTTIQMYLVNPSRLNNHYLLFIDFYLKRICEYLEIEASHTLFLTMMVTTRVYLFFCAQQ